MKTDGHRVRVVDCPAVRMDLLRLTALARSFDPDLAFWNTATPTLKTDLAVARHMKAAAPGVFTGVMGTHVTVEAEGALADSAIDAVVRGEPEDIIRHLCRSGAANPGETDGLSWRDPQTGVIHHNRARTWMAATEIPVPAWEYLDLEPYRLPLKGRRFLIVAPVRGCPWACSFCTAPLYYGKKLRKRPLEHVMVEIRRGIEEFGIRDFFVWADTFTADADYVKAFAGELVRQKLDIRWTCNSRVDTVNRELLLLMKEAGLWMISFGLESGSDAVLAGAGKRISVARSRSAVDMAHAAGIRTSGHFILGLPGETPQTMNQTLELALELPLDIAQFYAAAPFPGTRLYEEAVQKGWLKKENAFSQNAAALSLPGLSRDQVNRFTRYAQRRFYGRSKAVLNLLSMVEPEGAKRMAKSVWRKVRSA